MIIKYIEFILGKVGNFLKDLYTSNTWWVNSIVIIYAIFILWTHNNLRKIVLRFEKDIVSLSKQSGKTSEIRFLHKSVLNKWHQENDTKKFWLPTINDLWYEVFSGKDIPKLLHFDSEYVKIALNKLNGYPSQEEYAPHVYLAWEEYRHRLLVGIRSNTPNPKIIKERLKADSQKKEKRKSK